MKKYVIFIFVLFFSFQAYSQSLDSIDNIQTIVTCTGLEEFIDGRLTLDRIFRIADGTVTLEK